MNVNENIIFTAADSSLIPQIRKFIFTVITEDFGYCYNPVWHYDLDHLDEVYIKPKRNVLFLALGSLSREILGTFGIRAFERDFFRDRYSEDTTAEFTRCYVDKKQRRKGLGSYLVVKAEKFCRERGYEKVYLHTQKTVPGALEFWLHNGYQITGYGDKALGTVHMEKILRQPASGDQSLGSKGKKINSDD